LLCHDNAWLMGELFIATPMSVIFLIGWFPLKHFQCSLVWCIVISILSVCVSFVDLNVVTSLFHEKGAQIGSLVVHMRQ
jgi:hypothetical protein